MPEPSTDKRKLDVSVNPAGPLRSHY